MTVADQALSSWRSERRTERRYTHRLDKPAYAILEDGSYADVRLLDLTYEGCSIDCTTELKPGDRVRPDTGPKEHWPRRGIRVRLSADVSLRRSGKAAFKVTVFDISPYGCKVEFIERPSMDEHVWIRFPGLEPIEGEVCWVDQPTAGVSFAKSIHPAVFDLLLERLRETMR